MLPLQADKPNLKIINNLKQTIMKKFFTLIAAVAMAASVNAQTTYSFAETSKDSYTLEEGWFEWDATKDGQLNYLTGSKNEYHGVTLKDSPVSFSYKNSSTKNKVFTISDKYFCAQSSKVRIVVSGLTVGQEVTFSVASKGSTAAAFAIVSGCEAVGDIPTFAAKKGDDLAFQDVKVKATADVAIINETAGGFGIQSVTISGGGTTAISNVEASASAKASTLYNLAGQKVSDSYKGIVVKNGKKYLNK